MSIEFCFPGIFFRKDGPSLKFRNLDYVLGNHDWYLLQWFKAGQNPSSWTCQGGLASIRSFQELNGDNLKEVIHDHQNLLEKAVYYYVDDRNRAFVHGDSIGISQLMIKNVDLAKTASIPGTAR